MPQAVGNTPAGVFVFGWCVACLEASGCQQIAIAPRSRRATTRLTLERSIPWSSGPPDPPDPLDDRRRLAGAVALVLSLWGLALLSTGLTLWATRLRRVTPPPSDGIPGPWAGGPALLIGGGCATAVVGFFFWSSNLRKPLSPSPRMLRGIQAVAYLSVLATLLAGTVFRSPHRDPLAVGLASAALVVSAAARWLENGQARTTDPRREEV